MFVHQNLITNISLKYFSNKSDNMTVYILTNGKNISGENNRWPLLVVPFVTRFVARNLQKPTYTWLGKRDRCLVAKVPRAHPRILLFLIERRLY